VRYTDKCNALGDCFDLYAATVVLGWGIVLRKDLEDQIAAKLVSLSNEDAQRVAEDYVRIQYPKRFPYFGFRAFSPEGKSRSGWPDASSIGADGKIEGVEATHTASRAGVLKHLEDYLAKAKALKPGQLAGFLHVSVSPKASFLPDEIKDWTEKFVEAGFARDRVELVFGQGLVEILTRPEFARTRIEILGIQDLPSHFRLFRSKIGPDERRLGVSFIPNWEDFEKGRVYRSQVAETVTKRLDLDRIALVRGIGASGKTVLAWLLAQDVVQRGLPAYFFDFADQPNLASDVVNALIGDLTRFAHQDVLFVLDNIHLEETRAKELYLAWEEIPLLQRPRLLLVGRETRTAKGSAIAGLKLDAIPLRARQAELRGVFRRLTLREHAEDRLPEPPEAELTNWLRTFGGKPENTETTADLIVFSAAVARRKRDLYLGRWQLTQRDAVEQVKEAYLSKLAPPEQENLIRLCITEQFELGIQTEALADKKAALTTSNSVLGIVFREEIGAKKQYVRYRLIHAALGELLLSAAEIPIDRSALLQEMTRVSPRLCLAVATQMMQAGQLENAKAVIARFIAEPDLLLIFDGLLEGELVLRLIQRLGIELPHGFGETLANEKRNRPRLVEIALQTPLGDLARFLSYAEKALRPVSAALSTELAAEKNRPRLVEIALQTQLHFLASFLRYAEKALPPTFAALSTELAAEENRPRLLKIALQTPLGDLASFLRYAEKAIRPIFAALSTELTAEKNRPRLLEIALQTPLDHLATFLRYAGAEKTLRPVYSRLIIYFSTEVGKKALAGKIRDGGEDAIVSVLTEDDTGAIWREAFLEIDLQEWRDSRKNGPPPKIEAFVGFQKAASSLGKIEFANSPADRIVTDSSQSDWNKPVLLGLHHLSHVLRLATGVTEDQQRDFVARVATPDWLDPLYRKVPAGPLAGNLFAIAKSLPLDIYHYFLRESLRDRISAELNAARYPKSRADALSLFGGGSLLGVVCDTRQIVWPDAAELEQVLRLRAPSPESETIGVMDVPLWLGVRLMAAELERPHSVPAELGNRVLELWEAAQAAANAEKLPQRIVEINATMIPWLRECRAGGWSLLPPRR